MNQSSVHQYRMRLLNVLLADDLKEICNEFDQSTALLSAIDKKYWLLKYWDFDIENKIFDLIDERLSREE